MDLIDENGLFYNFQNLQERYNIHGTYLDYLHLIQNIPRLWRDTIEENRENNVLYNVQINCYVF